MKKKLPIFLASLLCVSCLSGCFPTGEPVNVPTPSLSSGQKQADITKTPTSIKKQLADNLFVDASISVPPNANWKNYQAKLKNLDVNLVMQQFFSEKKVKDRQEHPDTFDKRLKRTVINGTDGCMLVIQPGSIRFEEKNFTDFYYSYYIHDLYTTHPENVAKNFQKQTLDNVNKEQAVSLVKEKAKALGVGIEENPTVYALDVDSLNAQTDYKTMKTPKGGELHHWTKEDQAYAVTFRVLQDGLPITRTGYITSTNGVAVGTRLLAVVGTKGLLSFSIESIYEACDTPQPVNSLISLDTVLERIKTKYKDVILSDPVTVRQINLEYVPVTVSLKEQKYALSPMWVCLTEQTTTTKDEKGEVRSTGQFPIYMDAVTGKEMEISGLS
jgi:hypothetical protein